MQAGTCKLPCVNSDVVVMWCIPPPYSSPSFEVSAIFFRTWKLRTFSHWEFPSSIQSRNFNILLSMGMIMTLISPGDCTLQCGMCLWNRDSEFTSGSTLQCGTWLYADIPLHSPKRLPYWNSTSGFDFDHITAVDMSCCTSLQNFIQIGPPSAEKITSCRF